MTTSTSILNISAGRHPLLYTLHYSRLVNMINDLSSFIIYLIPTKGTNRLELPRELHVICRESSFQKWKEKEGKNNNLVYEHI